jgi:phosphoinositide-3-kinase regulatory subunit 4
MGNQLAAPARVQPGELLASDVPTLVYKDSLGGGRFLKTFLTRAEEGTRGGLVVVKAYLKRGAPGSGGGLDADEVRAHAARLRETREALSRPPQRHLHAWPFQRELETERALYLMRQYAHATLHDRVSTRPFLTAIEKRWFAFQLLHALAECHARGVTHGDIKCENVLVTSWGWAFLSDFATFKPAALPADNPADYSYFFDTGGRRRCYVAPERFVDEPGPGSGGANTTANAAGNVARDGRRSTETSSSSRPSKSDAVTPAADVFSLGCALGELFLDGSALFDLSQLLAYRRGEHDPSAQLAGVRDEAMRELVLHMIARDPAERLSAAEYLERWRARGAFPNYFDVAHDVSATLLTEDADQTARSVARNFDRILAAVVAEEWEGAAEHAASAETAEARSGGRAGAEGLGRGEEAPPVGDAPLGGLSIASRRSASSDVDDELGSDGSAGGEVDVGRAMEDIDAMMRDIGNLLGDRAPDRGDDEEDGEALLWRGDEGGVSDASGSGGDGRGRRRVSRRRRSSRGRRR